MPFDPELTDQGTFTLLDGTEIEVPLMHSSVRTGYADADQFQAIRLPYAGDAAMGMGLVLLGLPVYYLWLRTRRSPQGTGDTEGTGGATE